MYQTTWFDQNIPFWTSVLARFKGQKVSALEIGCFEGRATVWLLENILTHPESKITVVDTFGGSPEFPLFNIDNSKIRQNFDQNTASFKEKINVFACKSESVLPLLDNNIFDLIYIDGSHTSLDVLRDGVISYDLLKLGGSIIFDDYNWDTGKGEKERPHEAIQSLIKIWGGFYGTWKFWIDQAAFTKYAII